MGSFFTKTCARREERFYRGFKNLINGAIMSSSLLNYKTYQDYLDSFSIPADKRFLRNVKFCRLLVNLSYRSTNAVYTPEQFEKNKAAILESFYPPTTSASSMFSYRMKSQDSVLMALADREKPNIQKTISTIIFLKARLKSGFEQSGYIDYEESLRLAIRKAENHVDWGKVFQEKVLLRPSSKNLSYYDWKRKVSKSNDSDNYIIMQDVNDGLLFMYRGDHKIIAADTKNTKYAKNCTVFICQSDAYGYVILYDHVVRKRV